MCSLRALLMSDGICFEGLVSKLKLKPHTIVKRVREVVVKPEEYSGGFEQVVLRALLLTSSIYRVDGHGSGSSELLQEYTEFHSVAGLAWA